MTTATPAGIPDSLRELAVPVDSLRPYQRNPRNGDVDLIAESLRVNGQYRPIVVRRGTGEVLAGNHTLHAAMSLGWPEIAATFVDCTDEEAARIVLVDNRANDLARYDDGLLAQLLQDLPSLEGTGYDDAFLEDLLAQIAGEPDPIPEPDDVPPLPSNPHSRPGDVWLLGPHRVVCGDSSDVHVIDAALKGGRADLVWTDPPYGVAYVGKTKDALTIKNDNLDIDQLTDFLRATLGAALQATRPGAGWYVAAPAGPAFLAFATVLTEFGVWRQTISWVKNVLVMGHSDYHYRHEPVFYGHTPGGEPQDLPPDLTEYAEGTEAFLYGWRPGAAHQPPPDRKQDTVWEFPKPKASREHPTMKPVALIEKALRNSSQKGAAVLDVFGGSGSTLIACHQTGRLGRLVELDARYVDVICRRYQEGTGTVPVLEATGEPHDFTTEA